MGGGDDENKRTVAEEPARCVKVNGRFGTASIPQLMG